MHVFVTIYRYARIRALHNRDPTLMDFLLVADGIINRQRMTLRRAKGKEKVL